MSLITRNQLYQNTPLKKLGYLGKTMSYGLYNLMGVNDLNELYKRNQNYKSPEFEKNILKDLSVEYVVSEEDLKRIPKTGPFVIVSNHPLGGLDGIIMLKAISEIRPDFKIIGNFLLHQIEPLQSKVFPVNPFESRKEMKNSFLGMKEAFKHLKNGHPLGIFPAGEVSHKNKENKTEDRAWQEPIMKLIQKAEVPVIPMYFKASNSPWFYRLGALHPDMQSALLIRELLRPRLKPIELRIGKPISVNLQSELSDIQMYTDFLRKKTYVLESTYNQKKSLQKTLVENLPVIKLKQPKAIISETPLELLVEEVSKLENTDSKLFTYNNYHCFLAKKVQIPNVMREIGRLREITFREIGEGTNKSTDIDAFDDHYYHLFLWDFEAKKLAGAYRMGLGKEIYNQMGINGFYVSELFEFEKEIQPFFTKCIEMGRAFVVQEYQQKPWPLFLLWRGIVTVALMHPEYKYILGGVSISNKFSELSKALMIEFIRSHYYDAYVAQFIQPKKEFKPKISEDAMEFAFDEAQSDINKLDKLIEEFQSNAMRLPVLIKKYLKQNAKVIGFNVDPQFNDAIDGLMYIRISDIPESTLKPVLDELEQQIKSDQKAKN